MWKTDPEPQRFRQNKDSNPFFVFPESLGNIWEGFMAPKHIRAPKRTAIFCAAADTETGVRGGAIQMVGQPDDFRSAEFIPLQVACGCAADVQR